MYNTILWITNGKINLWFFSFNLFNLFDTSAFLHVLVYLLSSKKTTSYLHFYCPKTSLPDTGSICGFWCNPFIPPNPVFIAFKDTYHCPDGWVLHEDRSGCRCFLFSEGEMVTKEDADVLCYFGHNGAWVAELDRPG